MVLSEKGLFKIKLDIWAYQFLHICHKSKKEIIILKLDFEKAFDKVEHEVILRMFKRKGFSKKMGVMD